MVKAGCKHTFMSLRDAADRLGLAPNTLRIQANRGSLNAIKIGRDWVVEAGEVERYRDAVQGKPGNRYHR